MPNTPVITSQVALFVPSHIVMPSNAVTIEQPKQQAIPIIFEITTFVWILGFVIMIILATISYINLKQRLKLATLVSDNIFEVDDIKTPFVLGFIRPKIYLPTGTAQQSHIILHEKIHIILKQAKRLY